MKQLFLSISLALLAFTSCKKDKDNTPSKEPEELILGDWQVTSASLSPAVDWFSDGDTTTDAFTKEKPCRKDDYVTFKSNGTFEINEGESAIQETIRSHTALIHLAIPISASII